MNRASSAHEWVATIASRILTNSLVGEVTYRKPPSEYTVATPPSPSTLATVLTGIVGLFACALPLWLGVFRWAELRERHADLAVPFIATTAVFGLLVVSFPLYETVVPPDGYSVLNLVISVAVLIPWAVFGLRYAGRDHLLTARRVAAGTVLVYLFAAVFVLSVTGQFPDSTALVALLGLGLVGLLGGAFAVASVILLSTYRTSGLPLGQSVALVLPVIMLLMTAQGLGTDPDTRTFLNAGVFAVAAGSLWLAVTRYDGLTRRPGTSRLGLRSVVTEMDEAVFVVNTDGSVVSANVMARSLFGSEVIGDEFADLLGETVATLRDRDTLEQRTSAGYRQFDPRVSSVTGGGGQRLGVTVTLIDVTDREMRRQRIQVLNRILRHNIRNDLSAIKARADLATDNDQDTAAEVQRITTIADELESLSTSARRIEKLIDRQDEEPTARAIDEFVGSVVADVTPTDESAAVSVSAPSTVAALDWELLGYALRNLVENAVEHNDTQAPRIEVRCEVTAFGLHIVVADNGPGIPELEATAVQTGFEGKLDHATSIGLWGANWAIQSLGGKLTIGESQFGGAAVTIEIPLADDREDS